MIKKNSVTKRFNVGFLLLLVSVLFISTYELVHAQSIATGDGELQIDADGGIEWLRDEKVYVAYGNAKMVKGNVSVSADELSLHYLEKEGGGQDVKRVDAIGQVVLNRGGVRASGDRGAYDLSQGIAVLTGKNLQLTDKDLLITAKDSLEFWDHKDLAVARGDATLVRQGQYMRANVMTAILKENAANKNGGRELERLEGTGGVQISTGTEIIIGNQGIYYVANESAVVCGNVRITRDGNQLNGDCGAVDFKNGRARITGSGNSKAQGSARKNPVPFAPRP